PPAAPPPGGGAGTGPPPPPPPRSPPRIGPAPAPGRSELHGHGPGRDLLARAAASPPSRPDVPVPAARSRWRTSLDRAAFEQGVATIREHIGAGDCYQVNLTRRVTSARAVDPVALFAALEHANPSPHGAFLRVGATPGAPDIAVVSASPERFLSWRGPDVETCPIKGTGTDPAALRASVKDRAENVMIVDLARNDLGRVCEPGSVVV